MTRDRGEEILMTSMVEMSDDVEMRHTVDRCDGHATLYFGQNDTYALVMGRGDLTQLISLASRARDELDGAQPVP